MKDNKIDTSNDIALDSQANLDMQKTQLFGMEIKIGILKELHKKGFLSDQELTALLFKQNKTH